MLIFDKKTLATEPMSYQSKNIAIFASGNGTNAENLITYFQKNSVGKVVAVLTNRQDAGIIQRAEKLNIPCKIFDKAQFYQSEEILHYLKNLHIDWIVLAGFLWKIPTEIIRTFPRHIVNIHPALLPGFGGKGMYGKHVHEAVIRSGEKESGITIHLVNEQYDQGEIIFQSKLTIEKNETPETLAEKIHQLEYNYFPVIMKQLILKDI